MSFLFLITATFGILHIIYILFAIVYRKKNNEEGKNNKAYSVEHIVCFKNESKFIEKKVNNCNSLKYPHLHHTYVNDHSSDDTLELLRKYRTDTATIINNEEDLGKNRSQIKSSKRTNADLLLFTDANVFLKEDAVQKIVDSFQSGVSGVCGNVTITSDMKRKKLSGKYWEIEKKIKQFQSMYGNVIGFDGGFYCIKRKHYNITRKNELSDFESAFLLFEQKKHTKYVHDAIAIELEERELPDSFKARIRASNRVFWSFVRIAKYVKELEKSVILHFVFYKICRYLFLISFIFCLPFLIYVFIVKAPYALLIFLIPYFYKFVAESIALCIGGLIALFGKEYISWSDKKV